MLKKITELPSNIFGVKATGEVDANDLKNVLIPGLQKCVDDFGEIRYLLVLETPVGHFTAGAWVEDVKAGLMNFTKWKKIAVVTDQKAVEWFTDLFTLAVPGSSKGFKPEELEQAKTWLLTD